MRILTRMGVVALVLAGCVGCDQISKGLAREYLAGTGIHSYLGDLVRLEYAQNPGAFLSLGASLSPAARYDGFTLAASTLLVALLAWAVLSQRLGLLQRVALAAVGAAGTSNVIDRLRFDGVVTDFLNLGVGPIRTGIFNVADAILMVGVIVLLKSWSPKLPNAADPS
jgi:signal peptidase II